MSAKNETAQLFTDISISVIYPDPQPPPDPLTNKDKLEKGDDPNRWKDLKNRCFILN